jgi:hypothetical protein
MNKINFNRCLLFDDPIPYVSNNLTEIHNTLENEVLKLKNAKELSDEQNQQLILLENELQKQTLLFYPVKMQDCLIFYNCVDCLTIDKNSVPNPKVISMSYLDYLFYIGQQIENGYIYVFKLKEILKLSLCLDDKDIDFVYDDKKHIKIIINNIKYDKNDFEIFKEIICKQNNIELPDNDIHPDVKKALQEAQSFINRNSHPGTLEDQIDCVMVGLHEIDKQKIKNMSIRTFQRFYQRYSYKIQYQIYKSAEMGGMVSFKKPIDNWTDNFDRTFEERYSNLMINADKFSKKVKMEDLTQQ